MIRHYETGKVTLQIHSFIFTEAIRLGLYPLGVEVMGYIGNLKVKVFLHENMNYMDFKLEIEHLKQKCQEIVKMYKGLDVEILFFNTTIEARLEEITPVRATQPNPST